MANSIYDFTMRDIKGTEKSLSDYKGKVALIVNVASKCGLTPQYEGLQKLYERYKDQGFVVLGFPSNNFMGQEPGTEQEIEEFCTVNYNVSFPMFSKIDVTGANIHPLYQYLTTGTEHAGEVKWNFHKFLINREGQVVANLEPTLKPEDVAPILERYL